ncbi:hypothetical protein BX285_4710 [Streptomyces sp. 1114.5]|uniref:hypothetical protein n=1 Tax=unclassified Streptomyces TaxID=2593676 RepID=UPI000BE22201|nr:MULTISPECIES: hypothetical protein [unclassified Streptomyces]RKT20225.1 hypothetical protein BX285_4710 [Streptomyces sp. 1114.5]
MQQPLSGDVPESASEVRRQLYTGSERPFDPEDLVMASGRDVTPERVAWARQQIEQKGAAALERYLP